MGDEDIIFDADAAFAGKINARLDGDDHARTQLFLAAGSAERGKLVNVAADAVPEAAPRLAAFLADGFHGTMDWLLEKAGRRADPRALWPAAGAVVMLGLNYGPESDPLASLARRDRATISVYARNRD